MKRISLGWVVTGSFLGAIVITVSVILIYSYYSTRTVLVDHARERMDAVASSAILRSEQFLSPAQAAASLTQRLADHEVVSGENSLVMERLFYEQLRLNPHFSGIFYGGRDGTFVFLSRTDERVANGFRTKIIRNTAEGRQVELIWREVDFHEFDREMTPEDPYDPRTRPWYKEAMSKREVIWTQPYVFFSSRQPGITTASPVFGNEFFARGVVGVDIETVAISTFLSELKITPNTQTVMLNREGGVIGYPEVKAVSRIDHSQGDAFLRLARVDELSNPLLKLAFQQVAEEVEGMPMGGQIGKTVFFENENHLVQIVAFDNPHWPWVLMLVAPEDDFLAQFKANLFHNIYLTLLIALSACVVGFFVTRSVTQPVIALREEALEIESGILDGVTKGASRYGEIQDTLCAFRKMEEGLITQREENERLHESLRKTSYGTIRRLAVVAEFKDQYTAEHIERMSRVSAILARAMGYSEQEAERFRSAAVMHDIGKVAVPDAILLKPGKLDELEWKIMKAHPEIGASILADSGSSILELAREIALGHHERWDGSGYPMQLKGVEIPLSGRISAVADVFDALISKRPYKEGLLPEKACDIIRTGRGSHFDPRVVDRFFEHYDSILAVIQNYPPGILVEQGAEASVRYLDDELKNLAS